MPAISRAPVANRPTTGARKRREVCQARGGQTQGIVERGPAWATSRGKTAGRKHDPQICFPKIPPSLHQLVTSGRLAGKAGRVIMSGGQFPS